jgi:hypothetical protein
MAFYSVWLGVLVFLAAGVTDARAGDPVDFHVVPVVAANESVQFANDHQRLLVMVEHWDERGDRSLSAELRLYDRKSELVRALPFAELTSMPEKIVFLAGIAGKMAVFEVRHFDDGGRLTSFEVKTYALLSKSVELIGSLVLDKIHTVTVYPNGVALRNTREGIVRFYRLDLLEVLTLAGLPNAELDFLSVPQYLFSENAIEAGTISRSVHKIK